MIFIYSIELQITSMHRVVCESLKVQYKKICRTGEINVQLLCGAVLCNGAPLSLGEKREQYGTERQAGNGEVWSMKIGWGERANSYLERERWNRAYIQEWANEVRRVESTSHSVWAHEFSLNSLVSFNYLYYIANNPWEMPRFSITLLGLSRKLSVQRLYVSWSGLHRRGNAALPQGAGGVPWVCSSPLQPGLHSSAAGQAQWGPYALQGGDPHTANLCGCLQVGTIQ